MVAITNGSLVRPLAQVKTGTALHIMPDRRRHRGLHPEDPKLFGPDARPALRAATADLSWLLGRGYKAPSSTKLVGDRYRLTQRQRAAVSRAACTDELRDQRQAKCVSQAAMRGEALVIDGFNVLTTLEVALGGGVVLLSRDGTVRDIAGVHGSYRKVQETGAALALVAELARRLGVSECIWLLDRPVSNSGRLRTFMLEHARARGLPWTVEVVADPDRTLSRSASIVATADGEVLDATRRWFNLVRTIVEAELPRAYLVDLS
jgi:hypothetical protein